LIVALLLAALIAVGLGSYLSLNLSTSRLARRTFHGFGALNLAESGVEEAVWSMNRAQAGDRTVWQDWQNDGTSAWRKFSGFNLGPSAEGWVKVYVDKYQPGPGDRPRIVTQSSVGAPGGAPVTRVLEVSLRRRALFASGLVARDSIVFNGAVTSVDSWNSDPDADPRTAPVPYSPAARRDGGSIASAAVANSAVAVNQADIWGYVATGGGQPEVGSNGSVRGADTPDNVRIDPNRISTDFNADFFVIPAPADGTVLASVPPVLGVAGTRTRFRVAAIALSGRESLTILGDVTLVLTGTGGIDALSLAGQAAIVIPDGARLTIFVEGNVRLTGRGLFNGNAQPGSCQIFGVNQSPGGQVLEIAGNGALKCAIYAPNGEVRIVGNGDVMGAILARTVTLAGNAAFHYDEALGRLDSDQPFAIAQWRELTSAADRAAFEAVFRGW
jgi:hypothetical protein